MKHGPVTKLDKRNKTTSKNFTLTSCQKIKTSLVFIGFLAKLDQSIGQTSDTVSAKVMLSVIVTFCLTKTENRTEKSLTKSLISPLGKGTFSDKNAIFLQRDADISKIKEV